MRTGAARHALSERGDDLYETPACAVRALIATNELRLGAIGHTIWEPCAGRGAITRELLAAAYEVRSSDLIDYAGADAGIETPVDFLLERRKPPETNIIVTNPPYKLQDQFIRHGLELGLPMIVLLRLMSIEGAGRSDIMAHCVRIYAGIQRLPMMHRDGWTGPRNSNSGAPFGWFVFEPLASGDPIELHRISWREKS